MKTSYFRSVTAAGCILALTACAITPPSNVHQPMSARPTSALVGTPANGAIYQAQYAGQPGYSHRPLFEDRRARAVGDVLTININETTAASKKSGSTASRTSGNDTSVSAVAGLPGKGLQGMNLATNSASSFEGKG